MADKTVTEITGGEYYASDGAVWKQPTTKHYSDGTQGISLGFPVCTPHEAVGPDAAKTIASMLNEAEDKSQ